MDSFLQDARYALRVLRKSPGFALVAVLALALGIGANSAVFSVVNGVLLRPLPFAEPEQLVRIFGNFRAAGLERISVSIHEYRDYRDLPRALRSVAAYDQVDVTLTGQDTPERLNAITASASLMPTLGVAPTLGRNFREEEESPGQDRVLLLTHRLWRGRFGANPNILGTTVSLDGNSYTVVGVLPEGFEYPRGTDLYIPLAPPTSSLAPGFRGRRFLDVVARLKPGVTLEAAQRDMDRVSGELVQSHPNNYSQSSGWAISVVPMGEQMVGNVRGTLWVLLGAVGFVLLIACTNVANLLLARAAARGREISIRAALGAGRQRLVTQFLTESLILALAGGALGLLLAMWGLDALLALIGDGLPRATEVRLDGRVVLFTLGVSVLTGVMFGLVPALQASRADLHGALREGTRGTGGRASGRTRAVLVVSQVALALVLLVGAGLFMRSFLALQAVDAGFDSQGVLTARLSLPTERYPEVAQRANFMRDFVARVQALPGVESAGVVNLLPLTGHSDRSLDVEGKPKGPTDTPWPAVEYRVVSPDYHKVLRIPLLQGRLLTEADSFEAPHSVVINESTAKALWSGEDPIGRRIRLHRNDGEGPWATVVGVVQDVKEWGLDQPARPVAYHAALQQGMSGAYLVVRTRQGPEALLASLQTELRAVDSNLPLFDVAPLESVVDDSVSQRRFSMLLLMMFAAGAVVLASLGIYGVIAYTVTLRTRELGIRMALGARQGEVLSLMVGHGLRLTLLGVGIGLALALALGRLLSAMLYGIQAHDPLTFLGVAALLTGVALVASWLPARRAARVDPAITLRAE
ncbi:ABC transporter permease [Hyalangium rubrum]|uniref:ABC transporter permease n=1 Tax=Hyalangium rubrum TaxID=3103134 RepID=A0ABU5H626_9BACT|nr:ABC transporter permease [Hyalangium sp. s54d21]MDY7228207.1 ABC transporter permease [Hyalangium sp. s54d21]